MGIGPLFVFRALLIAALVTLMSAPSFALAASGISFEKGISGSVPAFVKASASSATHGPAGLHILVRFRADATDAQKADDIASVGGWVDGTIPQIGFTRVALPGDANDAFTDGDQTAALLASEPGVAQAELDHGVHLQFDPNDQYYWNDPITGLGQWGIRKAFVNGAWDRVRGSVAVTVAVLDTGVDSGHPDLQGALVPGATFVSQPSGDCDPSSTVDDNSHGTHVAGIVGANGNNGIGIAGVAFGVKVMPIKVLDCDGQGSLSDVATGITYAADHGARIVNLSLGSPFDSTALHAAVTYATQKNVLVVSAAGNCGAGGTNCTSTNQLDYPAAYPEVLAVGATDTDDSVAFFSTQNSSVKVVAPGRRIISTTPRYPTVSSRTEGTPQNYAAFSGTSQASPFVSGVAALVLSGEPTLTPAALIQRIESTADQLQGAQGTRNDAYGFGRVDALKAVLAGAAADRYGVTYDTSAVPKAVTAGGTYAVKVGLTNSSNFVWHAVDPGSVQLQWSWLSPLGVPVPGLGATLPIPVDLLPGTSTPMTFQATAPAAGPYLFKIDLLRAGKTFSANGAPAGTVLVTSGSGIGAMYVPTAASSSAGVATFDLGSSSTVSVVVTNTGTTTWPAGGANPVHLSYHWLQSGATVVWDGARAALPSDVPSEASVTVALPVLSPPRAGTFTLRIDLVQEGMAWFSSLGVTPQDLPATVRTAFVATYAPGVPPFLLPGGHALVPVTVTNAGTSAWSATGPNAVHLAAHVIDPSGNVAIWDGARTAFTADVPAGGQVQTSVIVDAPLTPGAYKVKVDLVREGIAWFSTLGVATGDVDLGVVNDVRAQILPGGPIAVSRANPVAQVTIKDTGVAAWTNGGAAPVDIGVHWYDANSAILVWDGARTPLPKQLIASNESDPVTVQLGAPPPGAAFVAIDLVSEGVAWFGQGSLRPVTFTP